GAPPSGSWGIVGSSPQGGRCPAGRQAVSSGVRQHGQRIVQAREEEAGVQLQHHGSGGAPAGVRDTPEAVKV
ncbi:unnamed protein product, partial [Ixodes pacificus]